MNHVVKFGSVGLGKSCLIDEYVFGVKFSMAFKTMRNDLFNEYGQFKLVEGGNSVFRTVQDQMGLYEKWLESVKKRAEVEKVLFNASVKLFKS